MTIGKRIGIGRSAAVFCWGEHQVIKLFPQTSSTVWINHEVKAAKIAYEAGLAVPKVEGIVQVNNRKGIVSERIEGSSMLTTIRLKPWKIFYFAKLLAELQATIHQCSAAKLPSLQQQRKLQIKAVKVLSEDKKRAILHLLERLPTGGTLCHGDFHPGNIICSSSRPTVIDWSCALQGNSLADVARTLLLLNIGAAPSNLNSISWLFYRGLFCATYLRHYLKLTDVTWKQIQPWLVPEAAAWLNYCSSNREQRTLFSVIERLLAHS